MEVLGVQMLLIHRAQRLVAYDTCQTYGNSEPWAFTLPGHNRRPMTLELEDAVTIGVLEIRGLEDRATQFRSGRPHREEVMYCSGCVESH